MNWISIKELLPDQHIYVLTFTPNQIPSIQIKWVFSNVQKEIMSSKSRFYKVTHWTPLPEPPK